MFCPEVVYVSDELKTKMSELHALVHKVKVDDWRLYAVIDELTDLLEYIINSSSMHIKRLETFDAYEIRKRLSHQMGVLE